jgi:hypothetical protein
VARNEIDLRLATRWWVPLGVTAAAIGVLFGLMFWQLPFAVGIVLDLLLVVGLLADQHGIGGFVPGLGREMAQPRRRMT